MRLLATDRRRRNTRDGTQTKTLLNLEICIGRAKGHRARQRDGSGIRPDLPTSIQLANDETACVNYCRSDVDRARHWMLDTNGRKSNAKRFFVGRLSAGKLAAPRHHHIYRV